MIRQIVFFLVLTVNGYINTFGQKRCIIYATEDYSLFSLAVQGNNLLHQQHLTMDTTLSPNTDGMGNIGSTTTPSISFNAGITYRYTINYRFSIETGCILNQFTDQRKMNDNEAERTLVNNFNQLHGLPLDLRTKSLTKTYVIQIPISLLYRIRGYWFSTSVKFNMVNYISNKYWYINGGTSKLKKKEFINNSVAGYNLYDLNLKIERHFWKRNLYLVPFISAEWREKSIWDIQVGMSIMLFGYKTRYYRH